MTPFRKDGRICPGSNLLRLSGKQERICRSMDISHLNAFRRCLSWTTPHSLHSNISAATVFQGTAYAMHRKDAHLAPETPSHHSDRGSVVWSRRRFLSR